MIRTRHLLASALATAALSGGAHAGVLYDNGAFNGHAATYNITGGNYAEDSFTIGSASTATGVDFVVWNYPNYSTTTTVDWAIFSGLRAPYTANGPLIASGTAAVTSSFLTNNGEYAVNQDTFSIVPVALASGTYSLYLGNATDAAGDQVRWDVNYGPSTALVHTNFGPFESYGPSNTFQILGSPTGVPEPAVWSLMIAGFGLLGGVARGRRAGAAAVV